MIIFVSGFQGQRWYMGPLLMVLPLVLNGELFNVAASLLFHLTTLVLSMLGLRSHTWNQDAFLYQLVNLAITAGAAYGLYRGYRWLQANGGWPALLRLLFVGAHGARQAPIPPSASHGNTDNAAAQQARTRSRWWVSMGQQQQQQQRRQRQQQPPATVETVAAALQKLPVELHMSEDELQQLSVHELKERLLARGIDCSNCIEKRELLEHLKEGCGSSEGSCSICCEDFVSGDAVRVLRCHHRYHIECVDKWFLSSTDYSRSPACPMCNAELL